MLESTSVVDFIEQNEYVSLKVKRNDAYDTIDGRLIIACDGVNGISRKKLKTTESNYIFTYQAFYHGTGNFDSRYFYAFLSPELSEYDAWVNMKDDLLILGVGVKKASHAKAYLNRLIEYLGDEYNLRLKEKISEEFWTLPIIIPDFKTVLSKGRVFFAGEAAGLINPMGEGISSAIASGIVLSKAVINGYASHPDLNEREIQEFYKNEMTLEIEHIKRQWVFLNQMSPTFWGKLVTDAQKS